MALPILFPLVSGQASGNDYRIPYMHRCQNVAGQLPVAPYVHPRC